jgi:hypothetical protein
VAPRDDRRDDRELEPLQPLDPMLAAPPDEPSPAAPTGERPAARPSARGATVDEESATVGVKRRGRSRRRSRLVIAAAATVVVVAAGSLTQGALDRRSARRAAVAFDSFEGTDFLLAQETLAVNNQMVPDDQPVVDATLVRAELAQAAAYTRELHGLKTAFWMDAATRQLVGAVRDALRARIADINALAAWRAKPASTRGVQPADPSVASKTAVDRALILAARHLVRPTAPNGPPLLTRDLVSSLQLSSWTDAPTGSTLAVADASGVALVDVDASTAIDLNLTGTMQTVVARKGYVAAVTPVGLVFAKAPTLGAPVTMLGEAEEILPAANPDAVWLVDSANNASDLSPVTTVTEVDGNSRRLVGAVRVPRGTYVTGGVTDEGLVLSVGGARLAVWDPATGHQRAVTSAPAVFLAASGHLVAWQVGRRDVNVMDVRTGTTRMIELTGENLILPQQDVSSGTCAFSPDAAQLACPVLTLTPLRSLPPGGIQNPYHLGVVDLASGTVAVLAGAAGRADAHPIVWAPDGSRLWSVVSTTQGSLLATWSPGQVVARELRYHARNWLVGLVVVDQRSQSTPFGLRDPDG